MQKILIILGIIILVIGLLYPYIKKIGLGQLPGDVIFKSGKYVFTLLKSSFCLSIF